jgi:anthranilate phosphoribosyltransferase
LQEELEKLKSKKIKQSMIEKSECEMPWKHLDDVMLLSSQSTQEAEIWMTVVPGQPRQSLRDIIAMQKAGHGGSCLSSQLSCKA